MLKKFLMAFVIALLFLNTENVSFAEVQEFSAEGEYRLGDNDTREFAKMKALQDAKRKIIEQVGVYVESYSEIYKFDLVIDQIKSAANAMIKITHEEVHFYEDGTVCRAFIVATIDLAQMIIDYPGDVKKTPPNNHTDILMLAGIEEYKGHYYKIFDESLNWFKASKRCKEMQGHLVTVTSRGEQAAIQHMIFMHANNLQNKKNYYWTGGFNISGQNWEWVTREKFSYTNWAEGEPDNGLGNEYILTICSSGEWSDCPAEGIAHIPGMDFFNIKNSGFICEWESYEDIQKLIDLRK